MLRTGFSSTPLLERTPGYVGPDRVYRPNAPRRFVYRPGGRRSPATHKPRRVTPERRSNPPAESPTPTRAPSPRPRTHHAPARAARPVSRGAAIRPRRSTRPFPLRARRRAQVSRNGLRAQDPAVQRGLNPFSRGENPTSSPAPVYLAPGGHYYTRRTRRFFIWYRGERVGE